MQESKQPLMDKKEPKYQQNKQQKIVSGSRGQTPLQMLQAEMDKSLTYEPKGSFQSFESKSNIVSQESRDNLVLQESRQNMFSQESRDIAVSQDDTQQWIANKPKRRNMMPSESDGQQFLSMRNEGRTQSANQMIEESGEEEKPKINQEQAAKIKQSIEKLNALIMQLQPDQIGKLQIFKPTRAEIQILMYGWRQRPQTSDKIIIDLYLENCDIQPETFRMYIDTTPSVRFWFNGERVESNGRLMLKDEYFFEGCDAHMRIISKSRETVYQGQAKEDLMHGIGMLTSHGENNQFRYQGQFVDNHFEGMGKLNQGNLLYVGEFKNDFRHGKGEEKTIKKKKKGNKIGYVVKSTYVGDFREGYRCGQGSEISNIATYEGQWKNGVKWGTGIMKYNNGDLYQGEWVNNQFNGEGKYTQKGNCEYTGNFKDGKYSGKGVMEYKNDDRYQGDFQKGLKHGQGLYTWADGDYYDGEWKNDSAQGQGTAMMGTDFYVGQYKNGMKHGEGELTNEQGDVTHGLWEDGELKQIIDINGQPVE